MNKFGRNGMVFSVFVFAVVFIVLTACFTAFYSFLVHEERHRYEYMAENKASHIVMAIERVFIHACTLREMIIDHNGQLDFFDKVADSIYTHTEIDSGVKLKNIAVAPGGVVEKVYPLKNNEAFLEFPFFDSALPGNGQAIEAYYKGKTIATNPFELIQGGKGMAARTPIYLQEESGRHFWGMVTVTLTQDELLRVLKLDKLDRVGVNYDLWYRDSTGNKVTMAASASLPEEAVVVPVKINNLLWHLSVAPSAGWYRLHTVAVGMMVVIAMSLLAAVVAYMMIRVRKINQNLKELAERDSLTMCFSRHYLNSTLVDPLTGEWRNSNMKCSLAIVDIDNFKEVNDTYGHDAGDRVLYSIASILKSSIRPDKGDCVIRMGGDEFVIIWNDIAFDMMQKRLTFIVEQARKLYFEDLKNLNITLSIGAEGYTTPEDSMYKDMMLRADEKLYWVKDNGRDRFMV